MTSPEPEVPEPVDDVTALLHGTTDAAVWATEFCRLFPGHDWALMAGWFANAIEVGRDAGRNENPYVKGASS